MPFLALNVLASWCRSLFFRGEGSTVLVVGRSAQVELGTLTVFPEGELAAMVPARWRATHRAAVGVQPLAELSADPLEHPVGLGAG